MKKTASKATKPALKNTSAAKKKTGRGGARPGAGRKKVKQWESQDVQIEVPTVFIEALAKRGITNKTEYILGLIAEDLRSYEFEAKRLRENVLKIAKLLNPDL